MHLLTTLQFTLLCCLTHRSHRTWLDYSVDLPNTVRTVNPKQATLLLFSEDPSLVLPQLSLTASQLKVALHVLNVFGDQVDLGQVKTRISAAIEKVSGKRDGLSVVQYTCTTVVMYCIPMVYYSAMLGFHTCRATGCCFTVFTPPSY